MLLDFLHQIPFYTSWINLCQKKNLVPILITLLILGNRNTNSHWETEKDDVCLSCTYSQSPSNDADSNNAQALLFCFTVGKTRSFSFLYSHGRNNYRKHLEWKDMKKHTHLWKLLYTTNLQQGYKHSNKASSGETEPTVKPLWNNEHYQ